MAKKTKHKKTPARRVRAPSWDTDKWRLQILIKEDGVAPPVYNRFTVSLAPDNARSVHHVRTVCIGAGPTREAAIRDAETELRGALMLLANAEGR